MQKSKIPWCTHTWNPCVGCSLPLVSKGCQECYARKLHNGRHKAYLEGKKLPKQYAKPFEEVQLIPDRLNEPLKCRAKNAKIFVGSMTDLFGPKVPFEFVLQMVGITTVTPWHTYQILTKRVQRMYDFFACWPDGWFIREGMKYSSFSNEFFAIDSIRERLNDTTLKKANDYWKKNYDQTRRGKLDGPVPFPQPNLWLGVTVCTQKEADEKIPILLQIPAAVRFVSLEPMLEEIDLLDVPAGDVPGFAQSRLRDYLHWVIVGCESGPKRRLCKHQWALKIVKQCEAANVPCFVKQLQENDSGKNKVIKMPHSWPQEYPNGQ